MFWPSTSIPPTKAVKIVGRFVLAYVLGCLLAGFIAMIISYQDVGHVFSIARGAEMGGAFLAFAPIPFALVAIPAVVLMRAGKCNWKLGTVILAVGGTLVGLVDSWLFLEGVWPFVVWGASIGGSLGLSSGLLILSLPYERELNA